MRYPGFSAYANDGVWSWQHNSIGSITMTVRDAACDGRVAKAYFTVHGLGQADWSTPPRKVTTGCGTSITWTGLYINNGPFDIRSVQFVACTEGVRCVASRTVDNPTVRYP